MVGGTQQQQLLHTQQPPTATESTTTPAEEEALKRNTDCVYFLASPLTCKKGSECEYRHSDIARVNPRDCWYWLNGNCLNPKCAFRHPPLDALMGIQVPTPVGPSLPQSQAVPTPAGHAQVPGKQGVPCIFFQKGFCLKGDRCPFFHAPYSANKIVQPAQSAAATPVTEPPTLKKSFGGLEKCSQEQRVPQKNIPKPVEVLPREKPAVRVDPASLRNGVAIDKYIPPPSGLNDEIPRYRTTNVLPATHGNLINRPNRLHQDHVVHQDHLSDDNSILNGKDADEFSREPSPGFDVLVDDELGDSDYYHNEDQFGRTRDHEARDLNPMNEYDIGRTADYNSMVDVDRDLYRDPRSYESYERLQGQFGWEDQRVSSERMLGGSANLERRRYPRDESPDRIEGSDLRHILAKQKRGNNGLRSVISRDRERDHARENHVEDRSYRGPRRDTRHLPPQESSLSSRLRGRIKIPGRSTSPVNENDLRSEREIRNRGRLSPGRPQTSSSLHQGRLRDRIKGRVQEDFNNEGRNVRGPRIGRDQINENNNNEFSGPKRLAELKVGKNAESYEQHVNDRPSLGKRKYPNQQSEGDLSFEGPKPLSEILKRKKRGSEAAGNNEDNSNNNNQKEIMESSIRTVGISEANPVVTNQEGSKSASGDFGGAEQEKVKSIEGLSSLQRNVSDLEEGMIGDEAMEDHEPEGSDHKEGNSDGEDYNLDGENAYPEEDYFDDDDADDFAKKMGVMYS